MLRVPGASERGVILLLFRSRDSQLFRVGQLNGVREESLMIEPSSQSEPRAGRFDFFTNHAHVLFLIAQSSDLRMRELAAEIGITERAVQRIVEDLTVSGYLVVTKEGRRNRYKLEEGMRLPHRVESHRSVGELVRFLHPE